MNKRKTIARLEARIAELMAAAIAADKLVQYLHDNAGDTDEWPIDLIARDSESAKKVNALFATLERKTRRALNQ